MMPLPEPIFIDGPAGRVFALFIRPAGEIRETLIYLPPFAEEMNRCRATVARQAYRLRELGCATLLVDPFGTGDSEGELADANWGIWLGDAEAALDWVAARTTGGITLWGLRTGALLAAEVANRRPREIGLLLLWQPVIDGRLFVTQTLRSRVAFLMDRGLPGETTDEMRETLQSGSHLEVAGYLLSETLVGDLDGKKLAELIPPGISVDWFEVVVEANRSLGPASRAAIAKISEKGCQVNERPFLGPPIWQLHKRDEVPDLIDSTTEAVRARHASE